MSSDKVLPVSVLEITASIDSSPDKIVGVLHVDDDAFSLKTTKQCLKLKGDLHVETAHSASEAMKKIKQENLMSSSQIIKCLTKTA